MAVDEVLMHWAAATGRCGWRFYGWQEPTLSLGYFQAYEDRSRHAASMGCPAVRRTSGGGAIVHDVELTYSFVAPANHHLAARRLRLYESVHVSLIRVLSAWGVEASLCGAIQRPSLQGQPFLCFQRRAPGDVLVGRVKIAGSAQRRISGAVLQHGSVLLRRCPAAPELDGLNNLLKTAIQPDQLVEAWLEALARQWATAWENEPLSEAERREVDSLVDAKFGAESWTKWRGRQGGARSRPT